MSNPIRVLVADHNPTLRLGLRIILEQCPAMFVQGEAGEGREAQKQLQALGPDVIILDSRLPGLSGVEIARLIRLHRLPTKVLAYGHCDDERDLLNMLEAGAVGYVLRCEEPERLVEAVSSAAQGKEWISPAVLAKVAAWALGERWKRPELTKRECTVLRMVADCNSNKEIGHALGVAQRTVEFHVTNLLRKLGFATRVQVVVWAREHQLETEFYSPN